jgi:hypothetical protein
MRRPAALPDRGTNSGTAHSAKERQCPVLLPRLRSVLSRLDQTDHRDRERTVALQGRDHAGDPARQRLLDGLASQSPYHRRPSLIAAAAAGDIQRLSAAAGDDSPSIRLLAQANLAEDHRPTDGIGDAMLHGGGQDRRRLRNLVNRRGLTSPMR